jgi:hypothetical protein
MSNLSHEGPKNKEHGVKGHPVRLFPVVAVPQGTRETGQGGSFGATPNEQLLADYFVSPGGAMI